jgi:hypothetical protein
MNNFKGDLMSPRIYYLLILLLYINSFSFSQSNFNVDRYNQFLQTNKNLTYNGLLSLHDIGTFRSNIKNPPGSILYLDSLERKIKLTVYEKELLSKHGFVVTERIKAIDYRYMFLDIWRNDIPVFITTDAILHALHRSYDNILKYVEVNYLIQRITELLNQLHSSIPKLESRYSSDSLVARTIHDVDFYLTVPRKLLNTSLQPYFESSKTEVDEFLELIKNESFIQIKFLSQSPRNIDFSQFVTRGHYIDNSYPQLSNYFKAMIWLGRMELYLSTPVSEDVAPSVEDIQRQIIVSNLILELIDVSNSWNMFNEIEKTISLFVGEQDNVTADQLKETFNEVNVLSALDLTDLSRIKSFQTLLSQKPFSGQKILSQVLSNAPFNPESIKPASAFLLFGQRFVIDSYITSNVVFDKILYNNRRIERILPSTLDILFALGNSASAQLLKSELEKYHYAPNLAALRYLVDSYDDNFWSSSIYNLWLNSIRTLSPPQNRSNLPDFMQTGAWWQQKMNTQLASWTELRHDNILYAKQSYTGWITCSYPYGYVEPIPKFYGALKTFADKTKEKLSSLPIILPRAIVYLRFFSNIMDTLHTISVKELSGLEFSKEEKSFLKKVLYSVGSCGDHVNGWYPELLFDVPNLLERSDKKDYVVADIHTAPTDEMGIEVGYVKHSGTGPINLMIVTTELPGVGMVAFAGPVYSYYEYTTINFQRLNDDEWKNTYLSKSVRPDWVNVYLADSSGYSRGEGAKLITSINSGTNSTENSLPENQIIVSNYPNPFNPETTIHFNIPFSYANNLAELAIYDIRGRVIRKLLKEELSAGSYFIKWNGKNDSGITVNSGIYFYNLCVGQKVINGKMNLIK